MNDRPDTALLAHNDSRLQQLGDVACGADWHDDANLFRVSFRLWDGPAPRLIGLPSDPTLRDDVMIARRAWSAIADVGLGGTTPSEPA